MVDLKPDPAWLTSTSYQGLVKIPSHAIFLRVLGPSRTHNQPVLIIEAGGGASGSSYIALAREVSRFARVYWYDRSGFGKSEKIPDGTKSTTRNHVTVLKELLGHAGVKPPWCLLGHSYGGNIARLFVQEFGLDGEVTGLLLLDAPPVIPGEFPRNAGDLLGENGDYYDIVGIKNDIVLTKEEMEIVAADDAVGQENGAAKAEVTEVRPGVAKLNHEQHVRILDGRVVFSERLFDMTKLCVVKGGVRSDYEKIFQYALRHRTGSEETRKEMRTFLESWCNDRFEQMIDSPVGLSGNARVVQLEGSGRTHLLHITVPREIAENVKWLMNF